MAKLGSEKRPAIMRVQTEERLAEISQICDAHGWHSIIGLEPWREEDISDLHRLLDPPLHARAQTRPGRNDPCPCGSGLKYKRCCALRASRQV
jgi:SWIM/SEC-C metal-binding protein